MTVKQRIITIFGATSGLARPFIKQLHDEGHILILHGRNDVRLKSLRDTLNPDNKRTFFINGDIILEHLSTEILNILEKLPRLPGGVVSFVGVPGRVPPEQWSPRTFSELFEINTAGPVYHVYRWCQWMKENNLEGHAVLISTMQALYPFENSLPYALSKAALTMAVKIMAKEFGGQPFIRVNGLAPGVNEAGMAVQSIQRGKYKPYVDQLIIPRYGEARDITKALLFLLDPDLYMTGQTLLYDGGLTLRRDLLQR